MCMHGRCGYCVHHSSCIIDILHGRKSLRTGACKNQTTKLEMLLLWKTFYKFSATNCMMHAWLLYNSALIHDCNLSLCMSSLFFLLLLLIQILNLFAAVAHALKDTIRKIISVSPLTANCKNTNNYYIEQVIMQFWPSHQFCRNDIIIMVTGHFIHR